MTLNVNRLVGGKGVSLRKRTVVRSITYPAVVSQTPDHQTITVPNSNILHAQVFMAPGANYSTFLQLGFNGQRMIPSDSLDDYIIGSGIAHTFDWGIDAYGPIDVWCLHNNSYDHTVYIRLDLDLQAVIDYAQPANPTVINPLRAVV